MPEDAQIQRAVLRINWTFKEKTQAQPIEDINEEFPVITPDLKFEPIPSPTEEIISNPIFIPELPLEITPTLIIEPTTEPTPILELTLTPTPEATSEPIVESTPISWWEKIIYKALAQEISSTSDTTENNLIITPIPTLIIEPTTEPTPILELTPTPIPEATSEPIVESIPEIIEESPMESVVPDLTPEATSESTPEPTAAPTENLIEISYSLDGMIWNVLTKVNRENWNNLVLEIPNFKTSDLQNLQISFQSLPIVDQDREIYLDGVVLEIEYETPLQSPEPTSEITPEIKQEKELTFFNHATEFDINNEPELFLAKPLSGSWMEKVEMFFQESTQVQEARLIFQDEQEIPVHLVFQEEDDSYRIRIRKPDNLMEGQYTFQIKLVKYNDIYKASTVFIWKTIHIPRKILSFSLAGEVVPTKKILEWHPKSWQLLKNSENNSIGIKLEKPQENEEINGYSEIILSGACREEYFVILAFKNINDYEKNPGGAILNKAFACENGRYYYKINELSAVFETGVYYLLVAEEDESNPWKPISALQPIQVKIEYK